MSNIPIKIIIILLSIIGLLAFILVYKDEVAPPTGVTIDNMHYKSIEEDVNRINASEGDSYNDLIFHRLLKKLDLYKMESFITLQEHESLNTSFIKKYVPVFYGLCQKKFSKSVWEEQDHEDMNNRVLALHGQMEGLTDIDECYTNLKSVSMVINMYNAAKQLIAQAQENVFSTVDDANNMINKASSYMSYKPLDNCKDIVSELSKVKSHVGLSHYYSLERLLENKLGNYKNISKDEYVALAVDIDEKIAEYASNKEKYGAYVPNVNSLYDRLHNLNRNALQYYERIESMIREIGRGEIDVFLNDAWENIQSPHSEYNAYCSYSNFNTPNKNSYMKFNIKGFSSFVFYVRSDGEPCCDYVIVGLDYVPSSTYYNFTTKGNPQSGTSFSNYQRVEFNGLNKNWVYTIHVIYRKDNVIDRGTDRGYILIPKI